MNIVFILKILDIVHDYILCPIFRDDKNNVQELNKKITELQEELNKVKGVGDNGSRKK